MKKYFSVLFVTLLLLTNAHAEEIPGTNMSAYGAPPIGYTHCVLRADPGCVIQESVGFVEETPELVAAIKEVAQHVRRVCKPRPDKKPFDWRSRNVDGSEWVACDCKGYALTDKAELIRSGIPSGALRIVEMKSPHVKDRHAFLLVVTDKRWIVLDSFLINGVADYADVMKVYGRADYRIETIQDKNGRWIHHSWFQEYGDLPISPEHPSVLKYRLTLEHARQEYKRKLEEGG